MLAAVSFEGNSMRIDKWLWCVRRCKTRATATAACRAGSVMIDGQSIKPAREVQVGEIITLQEGLIIRTLRVIGHPASRVAAKLVPTYCADLTPPEEFAKVQTQRVQQVLAREKGAGRPTKRDRRKLDQLRDRT
jgi:ribosome-associated heat shock protein Hsp15|uniref:RNA-binding S4 domain-containing protein n=1 Tax=Cephaloticoccus sp. TaxID=1985742 RepID=UPI0040496792